MGSRGGLNAYGFANGDPVNYSDPFGLCPEAGGGDGRTADYTDCPERTSGYYANEDAQGRGGALNNAKGVVASCAESAPCEHGAKVAGAIAIGWAGEAVEGLDELISAAKQLYPKKANKNENHHVTPQYLGGDRKGPTVSSNAAYHQLITNAFQQLHKYGLPLPSAADVGDMMAKVYSKLPIPSGP